MRKAIETKFHGATNTRGSRYSARAEGGNRVTMPQDYSVNFDVNHCACAKILAEKLGWDGIYVAGMSTSGDGYVYVSVQLSAFSLGGFSAIGVEGRDWFYVAPREGR